MAAEQHENPLWYKDAVIYEVHVRSFYDSNGDGIGDLQGLIDRLPYLEELGVTAVWLLPFYPSPLRDEGYDISDYFSINPDYGTMNDFREFLREAHLRGIRVITELVLNHTSDQHAWFRKSRRAKPGSPWRDFYVWSDTPDRYREARIIFKDYESSNWTWDPVANAYYWHRFYSYQPDLNFDNPRVHAAIFKVIDFWLGMGVDGLRLDAVPYLYEREGTSCENLPETHEFLRKLRARVNEKYPDRMLLAEANQWPEDATAYFGGGDECHMAYHFPLMPRMFMALQMEDRFPIIDILEQTPAIPDTCQWALFLRNHDELTLEMVTDEERDYMYRVYARDPRSRVNLGIRRRLAPLMGNDRRMMELMYVLLFTLPGTPIIYYGDEIGMGDNYYLGDRNGVRTPMQWSPDRNAGFSMANPQRLYLPVVIDPEYHYEAINVETQTDNPSSFLWWMRRMVALRKRFKAFGRGSMEFIPLDNPKVFAFIRRHGGASILVVANFSRFSQVVEISRPHFTGFYLEDLFSHNRFPVITASPYIILLGPYDYHILQMRKASVRVTETEEDVLPEIRVYTRWENVLKGAAKARLEREILPSYLVKRGGHGGKRTAVARVRILEAVGMPGKGAAAILLLFVELAYTGGETELHFLPLHFCIQDECRRILGENPAAVIALLRVDDREGALCDAIYHAGFRERLFKIVTRGKRVKLPGGVLASSQGRALKALLRDTGPSGSQILRETPEAVSSVFDDIYFFKLYRRLAEGVSPEAELGRFLTDTVDFKGSPPFCGALEYRHPGAEPVTLGLLLGYLPNQGDALTLTREQASIYLDNVLSKRPLAAEIFCPATPFETDVDSIPTSLRELMGGFFPEMVSLLGRRTGELHLALSSRPEPEEFAPEPFSKLYQRSVYQSMQATVKRSLALLGRKREGLPAGIRAEAERVLASRQELLGILGRFSTRSFSSVRIRIHGSCRLERVLFTGKDFMITDFAVDPEQAPSERKIKRSPFKDVAEMMRSFHHAIYSVLLEKTEPSEREIPLLAAWVEIWHRYVCGIFLRSYLGTVVDAPFVPRDRDDLEVMLAAFLLHRVAAELLDELEADAGRIMIPLRGLQSILEGGTPA